MNRIIDFVKRLFIRPKTRQWCSGEYFYHPKYCYRFTILSVPDEHYRFYDIYEYNWNECTHATISISNIYDFIIPYDFTLRDDIIWKYSIEEFLESIYYAIDNTDDFNVVLFNKVITRFISAANKIQRTWQNYNLRKKRKAVAIIEKYTLHYLYRPDGPLAPICFK